MLSVFSVFVCDARSHDLHEDDSTPSFGFDMHYTLIEYLVFRVPGGLEFPSFGRA